MRPYELLLQKITSSNNQELEQATQKLRQILDTMLLTGVPNSDYFHVVTVALMRAIKQANTTAILNIGVVVNQIANHDKELLAKLFSEDAGKDYNNQSYVSLWASELYNASFSLQNFSALIMINQVFRKLLQSCVFIEALQNRNRTYNQDSNPVLLITLALLTVSADQEEFIPQAELLAELLKDIFDASPDNFSKLFVDYFNGDVYKDKTIVYFLVRTLVNAIRNNPYVATVIGDLLIAINCNPSTSQQLMNVLCELQQSGPHEKLSNLQVMVASLLSSAYIENNGPVFSKLNDTLNGLYAEHPQQMTMALAATIQAGNHNGKTGNILRDKAMQVASERELEMTSVLLQESVSCKAEDEQSAFANAADSNTAAEKVANNHCFFKSKDYACQVYGNVALIRDESYSVIKKDIRGKVTF